MDGRTDMLIEDLVIAVCGTTKPCPNWRCGPTNGLPRTDDVCPDCYEIGRVYILGERARTLCRYAIVRYTPGWGLTMEAVEGQHKFHAEGKCGCGERGWFPTILLPDGRVDIGLLLDLLVEAGREDLYLYITKQDSGRQWKVRVGETEGVGRDLSVVVLQTVIGAFRHPEWWRGTDMLTEV